MSEDAYARTEGFHTKVVMAVLVGIVIVLWFILGYGYFTSPLPESSEPPTVWLVYEGELYSGILGSYCWADKCVDKEFHEPIGIVDTIRGSSVEFLFNSRLRPTALNTMVFVIDPFDNPVQIGELMKEENEMYKIDLQEGVYILQVQVNWQNLDQVNYTFKVRVN